MRCLPPGYTAQAVGPLPGSVHISGTCHKSHILTGDTLKQAIKRFGNQFLLIKRAISQVSRAPCCCAPSWAAEEANGKTAVAVGCVQFVQPSPGWTDPRQPSFCASIRLSVSLTSSVSPYDSFSLSLSSTKRRRVLGAGAAHFDAWLSPYHCLMT